MRLKSIELAGFKSFGKKTTLQFDADVAAIVGPNGSGKSNVAEAFRFALGEQSMKSMRGKKGEDLIWNGSAIVPRANRASVKLILDNTDRALNLDFDEVAIERVVHRDGGNDYLLNGSHVRLRDVSELLAQANIGASGHHIISQGEADRILSSSSRDRREMIEDALGLTAFLFKREDAERKLLKSQENIREVEGLRREIAPHLKFLEKQVKRIEEGEALKQELTEKYLDYFHREYIHLKNSEAELRAGKEGPQNELREIDAHIAHARKELSAKGAGDATSHELVALESALHSARSMREKLTRDLGRLEGELQAHERFVATSRGGTIAVAEAAEFADEVASRLDEAHALDLAELRSAVKKIVERAREFAARISHTVSPLSEHGDADIQGRIAVLEKDLHAAQEAEEHASRALEHFRRKTDELKEQGRQQERELFERLARRSQLEALLAGFSSKESELVRDQELFKIDLQETAALLGRDILNYENEEEILDADILHEGREQQVERRRKLERQKIKFEELGAGNSTEVLKEYTETAERDVFLARELKDLADSAASLRTLIEELTQTLEVRFGEGIAHISAEFEQFFKLMFGGGSASLQLVKEKKTQRAAAADDDGEEVSDENDEVEEVIEISVSLPHKRVKGLHMLSGGERALTSIALIFAMSQVNPPPFLILDETDAALDEANSRRYGDMIETLARRSQLIVITHNRETMSRAGILYGITMGSDGISKLLSVRFEEAVAVAK
jgi:chromosome segregation ATPase